MEARHANPRSEGYGVLEEEKEEGCQNYGMIILMMSMKMHEH